MGHFHDKRKERGIYERPNEEKLQAVEDFRKDGNQAMKEKKY